ncbi:hypothetical protein ACP275_08G208800 [Erythranthe tilingii]
MKRLTVISVPWVFCKSLSFVLSSTTVRRANTEGCNYVDDYFHFSSYNKVMLKYFVLLLDLEPILRWL